MPKSLTLETAAFVTFYSFKGGVGRSMCLINVAGILAGRGFNVLALDMDLEAPGISYLMRQEANLGGKLLPGFVDLLSDACERGPEADLFALSPREAVEKYSYLYTIPESIRQSEEGMLRIMPAGQFDGQYQQRLDTLDLGTLYRDGRGSPLIAAFKQVIQEAALFDFVFIDSRTGFSDESGVCTRDLGDYLMVVMGLNRQNEEGTAEFLRALRTAKIEPKGLHVILSPVPNGEDELVETREKEASATLSKAFGKRVDLSLQIPYHPRLALTEEPHIFRRSRGYLYEAYAEIERTVLTMLRLTVSGLSAEIQKAAKEKKFDFILSRLEKLRKLDEGDSALEGFAMQNTELAYDEKAGELRAFLATNLKPDSWVMGRLASSLHAKNLIDAGLFYSAALRAHENEADFLGDYALFLTDVRKDHDGAEALYKRALEADPKHGLHLGNYANFLTDVRKDHDGAEVLYKRALEAEPKNANILGNYALFLTDVRKDYDVAEMLYKRALEAEPKNANILGNYALFLTNVRKDHDGAEALYKRALEADPKHANHLGNYATFLTDVREDYDEAEALYKRTLEVDPKRNASLGNYATFLRNVRRDHDGAEALYKRALEADPKRAITLGNYAQLLFILGRNVEAQTMMAGAWAAEHQGDDLKCELLFYACAHEWTESSQSLVDLKKLLLSGARSEGWQLDENVKVAREEGHPEPDFLAALAKVISGKEAIEALEHFVAWQKGRF